MVKKIKFLLWLGLVLSGGLFGCATTGQADKWPVFYDSEKGATKLVIPRQPEALDFYTNGIPAWNRDLMVPRAKINSAVIQGLGDLEGLRVVEARLTVAETYYTDVLMILEEIEPDRFLPVYVQNYNRQVRWPTANRITKKRKGFTVDAGMEHSGTGHFHRNYTITIWANREPVVEERRKK